MFFIRSLLYVFLSNCVSHPDRNAIIMINFQVCEGSVPLQLFSGVCQYVEYQSVAKQTYYQLCHAVIAKKKTKRKKERKKKVFFEVR